MKKIKAKEKALQKKLEDAKERIKKFESEREAALQNKKDEPLPEDLFDEENLKNVVLKQREQDNEIAFLRQKLADRDQEIASSTQKEAEETGEQRLFTEVNTLQEE